MRPILKKHTLGKRLRVLLKYKQVSFVSGGVMGNLYSFFTQFCNPKIIFIKNTLLLYSGKIFKNKKGFYLIFLQSETPKQKN